MLAISEECFGTMQAPFKESWTTWCTGFLASRSEVAAMDPKADTAKFAASAYDWATAHRITASQSIARLAYLSLLTTPAGAAPANPLERFGLPATDEALTELESVLSRALGES